MGHTLKIVLAIAAMVAVTAGFLTTAEAKRGGEAGIYRYVTAYASTGGKRVTAPVRKGRWGDEVRTPGGNWHDCEITCEYTLRRLTVDFWESQRDGGFVSPGYLRFDFDLDTLSLHRKHSQ